VGAAYILDPINEIEVVDDYTVKFKLSYSAPLDVILAAGYGAWIYSPKAYEEKGGTDWFKQGHCVGTGPYTMESYELGSRLVMTRFDDYWGGWKEGQFDKIVFELLSDPTVLQQKIESGDASFTYNIPADNLAALKMNPNITISHVPSFIVMLCQYNTKKPPLDNNLVRQAISYAFPFDDLITAMGGRAVLAHGPVPPGVWGHSDDIFQFNYDLDKAKQLLAEAGYPNGGFKLVLTYLVDDLDKQLLGELWKPELAKLGIDLQLQAMTWDAQWDLGKSGPENAQDIFVQVWWPDYVSPISFLYGLFHTESPVLFNLNYYSNPTFDKLIDDANALSGSDRAKATQMFIDAQKILAEDVPSLFPYYLIYPHLIRSDIKGYVDNPAYAHVVFVYDLTRQ
jgi:peptide/nickel transport system substrate-binding protein